VTIREKHPDDGIRLVWDAAQGKHVPEKKARPRHRGQFIPPISAEWFKAARRLSGEALAVGAIIHMEAAKRRSKQIDKFTGRMTESFGIAQRARQRALDALETAGLVRMGRRRGSSPQITIIERD
jgi:hypothetical protein